MREEYAIWLIVSKGWATLVELETTWSLDDIDRAMALMDCESALHEALTPKKDGDK